MPRDGLSAPSYRQRWIEGEGRTFSRAIRGAHSRVHEAVMTGIAETGCEAETQTALDYIETLFDQVFGDRLNKIRKDLDEEGADPDMSMKRSVKDIIA